jgi:hypothetical protein
MICGYGGGRDELLVAYLYGDIGSAERAAFDAHLAKCVHCRTELTELRGVRAQLDQWAPPEPVRALAHDSPPHPDSRARVWTSLARFRRMRCGGAGVLGVAAGLANSTCATGERVDGAHRLVAIRGATGPRAGRRQAPAERRGGRRAGGSRKHRSWRDLVALERRSGRNSGHRDSLVLQPAAETGFVAASSARDGEVLRRVRALLEESERKQQRELALRVAQVIRDVNAQREADLVKIDRSLGLIQNNTGVEAMKQRELLNYLVRVSQKQ